MRVDVYIDRHDGTFRFVYEDMLSSRELVTGRVADVPSHAWLREVCIYANVVAWDGGAGAAKTYLDKRFTEIKPCN